MVKKKKSSKKRADCDKDGEKRPRRSGGEGVRERGEGETERKSAPEGERVKGPFVIKRLVYFLGA